MTPNWAEVVKPYLSDGAAAVRHFRFEDVGRAIDQTMQRLVWPIRRWRRQRLQARCPHPSWTELPWTSEMCARCGLTRTRPGWEHAVIRIGSWRGNDGFMGYGAVIYKDAEVANLAKLRGDGP